MLIFLYLKKSAEQVKVAMEEDLPAVGSLLANSNANQHGITMYKVQWH